MRRLALSLLLLTACGGPEGLDPTTAKPGGPATEAPTPAAAPLPGPDHPEANCLLLGNGCAGDRDYQMCCVDGRCSYTFSDGVAFATLDEALGYCTEGLPPAGSTPLQPADGGGYEPPGTRDGRTPPGTGAGGSGGNGGSPGGGQGGDPTSNDQTQCGGGSGGQCYGTVQACQARVGPASCRENGGCYYRPEACLGTAWACQSFYSPSQCGFQLGCAWDHTYEQCVGGAASCGSRGSSGSCHSQRGCYWEDATCSGAAWSCSSRSTESSCRGVAGCYWR